MPRFHIPHPHIENDRLTIKGNEARHIRRSLRLRAGDQIVVFDGSGKEYEGRIVKEEPTSVVIQVENLLLSPKDSPLEITLAQSLLKGEKMDYLVQKATELGVGRIIPFFSLRSVPLLERSKKWERHRRWERIAIEASKQCGRGVLPEIDPIRDYSEVLSQAPFESLRLILWEEEGERLKEVLKESKDHKGVFFIVGPEGGLSQEEVERSKGMGFIPVYMGQRILRAETASLCMLSIIQYEWGDIG
jgi:16S rRNA (uracil1498-N3)-methyltransferase